MRVIRVGFSQAVHSAEFGVRSGKCGEGGPLKMLRRFPDRAVGVVSGSGSNGPLFRDVQDRIDELADVLKAGNAVEASAALRAAGFACVRKPYC